MAECNFVELIIAVKIITLCVIGTEAKHFEVHQAFNNISCSDHAEVFGIARSVLVCGMQCNKDTECRGIFYNFVTSICTLVKIIVIPDSGCQSDPGSQYYIKLDEDVFDCHPWSAAEETRRNSSEPDNSVCTSHANHAYHTDVGASAWHGCNGCPCCKTKGCYTGDLQLYSGTWARSISGRQCQRWDQKFPHNHTRDGGVYPPGETYIMAENYCRDPDYEGFLWCYTTDPGMRFETCGIPSC